MNTAFIHAYAKGHSPTPSDDEISVACLLASAATARKFGYSPIVLAVDDRANLWFQRKGLLGLYDYVTMVVPEDVESLHLETFWAIGKMIGANKVLAENPGIERFLLCDLDAFVRLSPEQLEAYRGDATFVVPNAERRTWSCYARTPRVMEQVLRAYSANNFKTSTPYNVGFLYGEPAKYSDRVRLALEVAKEWSDLLGKGEVANQVFQVTDIRTGELDKDVFMAEMMFVEQWLPFLSGAVTARPYSSLTEDQTHTRPNPDFCHLHSSKGFYATNTFAAERMLTWLLLYCEELGVASHFLKSGLPTIRVTDPNSGEPRFVRGPESVGPGETVRLCG